VTIGSKEDGSVYIELTKDEWARLRSGKRVSKLSGDCRSEIIFDVKMTRKRRPSLVKGKVRSQ